MNCRVGDIAYFCRVMPDPSWQDLQSILTRAMFGHAVAVLELVREEPVPVWRVQPMQVVVFDAGRHMGGVLTYACDAHLVPIAGVSRSAELLGVGE